MTVMLRVTGSERCVVEEMEGIRDVLVKRCCGVLLGSLGMVGNQVGLNATSRKLYNFLLISLIFKLFS